MRFPGSLFPFEQTGLFPAHLFCIHCTCFRSPERLDCMPLHLLTRSCTSQLFTAKTRVSLQRSFTGESPQPRKTCFAGGLSDQRRLWIFGSGSGICQRVVNQMAQPHLNIRVATSLIRHVAFLSPRRLWSRAAASISASFAARLGSSRLDSTRIGFGFGVWHSGRVASPPSFAAWRPWQDDA